MSRVVRELGMKFEWGKAGAKVVETYGTAVPAVYDDGLMYLTWEAFQPIRSRLIESHKDGRPMCQLSMAMAVKAEKMLTDSGALEPVVKELDDHWKGWLISRDTGVDEELPMSSEVAAMGCRAVYDKDCGQCREAMGPRRQHRKGAFREGGNVWVMSADLSGPHPVAMGTKFVYLLVAVVVVPASVLKSETGIHGLTEAPEAEETLKLPFVKGLQQKTGKEVADALKEIFNEVDALFHARSVLQFHSDAGKEFVNVHVKEALRDRGIHQSTTQGHDPAQNGMAERYVGLMKSPNQHSFQTLGISTI